MFKISRPAQCQSYNIILEEIIQPYWDLIGEIFSLNHNNVLTNIDFTDIDEGFAKKILETKFEEKTEEEISALSNKALSVILTYFVHTIFKEKLSSSPNNPILLVYEEGTYIISNNNDSDVKLYIRNLFAHYKILDTLISLIQVDQHSLLSKLRDFDKKELYKEIAEEPELDNQIDCPVIPSTFLDTTKLIKEVVEVKDIWINQTLLEKKYSCKFDEIISSNIIKTASEPAQYLAIEVNNICFVINNDIFNYITPEYQVQYFWCLLRLETFRIKGKLTPKIQLTDLVNKFLECSKKEEFTNLLSNLENNLYLKNEILIAPLYADFFESLIPINKLSYMEDFEFFLSNGSYQKPILGIYNHGKKATDKNYNLVQMIEDYDKDITLYDSQVPKTKKKEFVNVLIPKLAYFYLHDFFEFYFKEVLTSLNVAFLHNYKLQTKDAKEHEIDFIINKNNNIYFVETKTRLTTRYIANYVKKCEQWTQSLTELQEHIHFIIIGCFSDEDCGIFKYMEKCEIEGYNISREGLKCIPYYFKIPLASNNKDLICISESSFDRLKKVMKTILEL